MRYFYWAILALNVALFIRSLVTGSPLWWANVIGIVAMLVSLYFDASTRRSKRRLAELHAEHERRWNDLRKNFR